MTTIKNIRRGCVGVDLLPPLKPMRRRDEDCFDWLRDDPDLTLFTRQRRSEDRRFVSIFLACAVLAVLVIAAPLYLTGHGSM